MRENLLSNKNIEKISFYAGIFFLVTAPGLSIIFFLFSIIRSPNNRINLFQSDWWNRILIFVSLLMLISNFMQFYLHNPYPIELKNSLRWLGLVNWLPLFWCFWAFQPYLKNPFERKRTVLLLVSGTIPIIFSGFAQYWFNINGPWEALNGLIIWYQRPIEITDGLTGPFNNTNYAGAWLALTWPFVLTIFKKEKNKKILCFAFILIVLFAISIILTNSRNAWLGLLISVPIIMGKKIAIWTYLFVMILLLIVLLTYSSLISPEIKTFILNILPHNFMSNFPQNIDQLSEGFPRIGIWKSSIEFINERPFIGWGAASFPLLYELQNNNWIGHSHNLLFEVALSYGILPSIILSFFVFVIIFKSFRKKFKSNIPIHKEYDMFDKAWINSTIFIAIAHLIDIQYFDLRISIITWILLAGLRSMLLEKTQNT